MEREWLRAFTKCETENGTRNLIEAATSLPIAITTRLRAEVAGVDWKTVIAT